jgi:hypothetical protein
VGERLNPWPSLSLSGFRYLKTMSINSLYDIITLSHSQTAPKQFVGQLNAFVKRDVGETILASPAQDGQDPLTVLHPQIHTIGALYIL